MSYSALDTLTAIRAYLAREILPGVAGPQQGEMRAALKVLDELGAELDLTPVVLHEETMTLYELCTQALAVLEPPTHVDDLRQRVSDLGTRIGPHPCTLRAAQTLNDEAAACMSDCVNALQTATHGASQADGVIAHLHTCYTVLARHAARRSQWQSVFPP